MSEEQSKQTCPRCGAEGKKVKAITIDSQVTDEAKESLDGFEGFRFCGTADCPVAYYRPGDGAVVEKTGVRFPIFQKEESPERLVCYCFQHSVREIRDEVNATGDTKVIQEIKDSCKRGMDDCARNNPQGSCCLGNVAKVVKEAKGLAVVNEAASCCSERESEADAAASTMGARAKEGQAPKLVLSGALLAAMASSACCWLPLLLIGTGLSAAGVAGFFEAYRSFFIIGSVALLGLGFYFVYIRTPVCEDGTACAAPNKGMRRFTQSKLWVAAGMIAAFTLFPNALSVWSKSREESRDVATVSISALQNLDFVVEGMTCAACAVSAEKKIEALPGIITAAVDYRSKSATVVAEDFVSTDSIVNAVSKAGYEAKEKVK